MNPKTRKALDEAKRMFRKKQYDEALEHINENMDQDDVGNCIISFFEGECYEGKKDYYMATLAFKNAYLSSLAF